MKRFLSLLLCALLSYSVLGCVTEQKIDVSDWNEMSVAQDSTDCPASVFLFGYVTDSIDQNGQHGSCQQLDLIYTNRQSQILSCTGSDITLVCLQDEKWYKVPCKAQPTSDSAEYRVQLNGCSMIRHSYSITDYYDHLPKGKYRLLFPLSTANGDQQQISVPFTIF
jgi:hypothetical protein